MFVKYSALVLFLSLVSALDVLVPCRVQVGTPLNLNVSTVKMDPTDIDLLLCVSDGKFYIPLATNATVAPTMEVDIPSSVPARSDYFIAATAVRNTGIIYSKSKLFAIESA